MEKRKITGIFLGYAAAIGLSILCLIYPAIENMAVSAPQTAIIVIDAGHGGKDAGTSGTTTKIREADINLAVALLLRDELTSRGVQVIMTRSTTEALAEGKMSDMQARKDIIEKSGACLAISIHMNSNADTRCTGPVTIYKSGSINGEKLANMIQNRMVNELQPQKHRSAYGDSLYILNCGTMPCVIVECGFLSNAEDEALLCDQSYRERIAESLAEGIMDYLDADAAE